MGEGEGQIDLSDLRTVMIHSISNESSRNISHEKTWEAGIISGIFDLFFHRRNHLETEVSFFVSIELLFFQVR